MDGWAAPPDLRLTMSGLWRGIRRFLADEDGTSDVEYVLILWGPVPILFFTIPPLLMSANFKYFDMIQIWINLPFP